VSLFGYLVTHAGREHSRESLAEMLWPERPAANARRSLHTALWQIRSTLKENGLNPDEILDINGNRVSWINEPDEWLDVAEFEQACAANLPARLEQAVRIYRGPFLQELYDNWCIETRYQLEEKYCWALGQLAQSNYDAGDFQAALEAAQRLLHTDALREEAHGLAMQAFYQLGNRAAAIEQYAACQEIFHEQLGIAPSGETRALYEAISSETLPRRPPACPVQVGDLSTPNLTEFNQTIERLILANPRPGSPTGELRVIARQGQALIEAIPGVEQVTFGVAANPGANYAWYVRIRFRDIKALQGYETHPNQAVFTTQVWQPEIAEQMMVDYTNETGTGDDDTDKMGKHFNYRSGNFHLAGD